MKNKINAGGINADRIYKMLSFQYKPLETKMLSILPADQAEWYRGLPSIGSIRGKSGAIMRTKEEILLLNKFENEILELIDGQGDFTRSDLQGRASAIAISIYQAGKEARNV